MPQPRTVDDYIDALADGLDPSDIPQPDLEDLVACLEARQQPVDIDGCILLTAAAVRALGVFKRDQDAMVLHPDCGVGSAAESNVIHLAKYLVDRPEDVVRRGALHLRKNQHP